MIYKNISSSPKLVVKNMTKVKLGPGKTINLKQSDLVHTGSNMRYFAMNEESVNADPGAEGQEVETPVTEVEATAEVAAPVTEVEATPVEEAPATEEVPAEEAPATEVEAPAEVSPEAAAEPPSEESPANDLDDIEVSQ